MIQSIDEPDELLDLVDSEDTRLTFGEKAKEILLPSVQLVVRNKTHSGVIK